MESNAWLAADNEPPMPYTEMESLFKEIMTDSGYSGEVQVGIRLDGRDKISNLENKLSALENRLQRKGETSKPTTSRPMIEGRDVCFKFNSADGKL